MIASALNDCFRTHFQGQIRQSRQLSLFSDSCFGQNKNMNTMSMLMALRQFFPNLGIEYTFPIRGHSFLSAYRVFGRIEQKLRKIDTILLPEEYHSVLQKLGNVHIYGVDWEALDYRSATNRCLKAQRNFKISEARMLQLNTDKVGFKSVFSGEYCFHSILKRGKWWADLKPVRLPMQTNVKDAKKRDVFALLRQEGVSDEVQAFYNDALSEVNDNEQHSDEESE